MIQTSVLDQIRPKKEKKKEDALIAPVNANNPNNQIMFRNRTRDEERKKRQVNDEEQTF